MSNQASELVHRIEKLETLAKVLKDELKVIQDECKHIDARLIHPGSKLIHCFDCKYEQII